MATLSKLPEPIFHTIFSFLPAFESISMQLVSRSMKAMIDSYISCLEKLDLMKFPRMTSESFQNIIRKTHLLKKLKVECISLITEDLVSIPWTISILKLKVFDPDFIFNSDFKDHLKHFSNLKLLKIKFADSEVLNQMDEDNLDVEIAQISQTIDLYPFIDYNFGHVKFFDLRSDEDFLRQGLVEHIGYKDIFKMNLRLFDCQFKTKHIKLDENSINDAIEKYPKIEVFRFLALAVRSSSQTTLVVTINTKNILSLCPQNESRCACELLDDDDPKLIEFAIIAKSVKHVSFINIGQLAPSCFSDMFDILPNLKGVKLQSYKMNPDNLTDLLSITKLKSLKLNVVQFKDIQEEFIQVFRRCSLSELEIQKTNYNLSVDRFRAMCEMKSLCKLRLSSELINDQMMLYLPKLFNLTHIFLHGCKKISSQGLQNIGYLHNLNHLEIALYSQGDGIMLNDIRFIIEKAGRNLETINFYKTKFEDVRETALIVAEKCICLRFLTINIDLEFAKSIKSRFRSLIRFMVEYNNIVNLRS